MSLSKKFKDSTQNFGRCCNPYKIFPHNKTSSLRLVSQAALNHICSLTANDRICSSCRKRLEDDIKAQLGIPKTIEADVPMEIGDDDNGLDNNNNVLRIDVYGELSDLVRDFLDSTNPLDVIDTLPPTLLVHAIKFFYNIVDTINHENNSKNTTTQLLTLFPLSMSVTDIKKYLNVSEYSIHKSKQLLRDRGILAIPSPKKGKELPQTLVDFIIAFYQKDDISSERPNVKDIVVQKLKDGTKIILKRRLLHWNLKEVYELLKLELLKYPELKKYHIGFTKFTLLRPKNVILIGSAGTHNVCVCAIHQNVKLLILGAHLAALTKNENIHIQSYRDCFPLLICKDPTEDCYFLNCSKCPGTQNLIDYLMEVFEKNEIEKVTAKQWTTDNNKTTLESIQYDYDELIDVLAERLKNLLGHAYTADKQSKFSAEIEKNLKDGEFKVVVDFAENYSYVVQDAIQGFHWNNDQATIYNVVIYYRKNDKLYHRSLVIVSENRKHDAISVYTFTKIIVDYLQKNFSNVKKIYYFSDGAPQQYKNYKNVINLAYHKEDFGIEAEWHFYPTSHGKGPCDGLGACVKHGIRSYCLQSKGENQIINIDDLKAWLSKTKRFPKIDFKYSSTKDYNENERKLKKRFQITRRVEHLQEQHCLIPLENGFMRVKRFSSSTLYTDQQIL